MMQKSLTHSLDLSWKNNLALVFSCCLLKYIYVMENSSLLSSSRHLELVISENSQFFACYFDK